MKRVLLGSTVAVLGLITSPAWAQAPAQPPAPAAQAPAAAAPQNRGQAPARTAGHFEPALHDVQATLGPFGPG